MTVNEFISSLDEEVLNYNGVMLLIPINEKANTVAVDKIGSCTLSDSDRVKIDVSSFNEDSFELYSNYGFEPVINEYTDEIDNCVSKDHYKYVYDKNNRVYVVY